MKKDIIENIFENLHDTFDTEVPNAGHEHRFLDKLQAKNKSITKKGRDTFNFWNSFIAIAASVIICVSLFTITQQDDEIKGLASVSPELSETQNFFTNTITKELAILNSERTPETSVLIDDAIKQLNILETEYETLKTDLTESGNDKRVIYAMVTNFQNRINVLQNVLQNIENFKLLKHTTL